MKIDARKKLCPMPVIMAKKALREAETKYLEIIVDNSIAVENLSKMANQLKYKCDYIEQGEDYKVIISKDMAINLGEVEVEVEEDNGYIVVFSKDEMGFGDEKLSKLLVENYVYALGELDSLPKKIIFYNSGVYLVTENKKTVEDLKLLEDRGVEILVCGLCLDYYKLKEKLNFGVITNMYTIAENLGKYRVVNP